MTRILREGVATDQSYSDMLRLPKYLGPGHSTATNPMIDYRLGKLQERGLLKGVWLDCGCADGGYTLAMLERGAERAMGIDVMVQRVILAQAKAPGDSRINFGCAVSDALPFADSSFDGIFLNEVLEHVADEIGTLRELRRVLRPGGHLALMSPNRWFPFEGHGMRIGNIRIRFPVPFLPWIPSRLAMRFMSARNYWPSELVKMVARTGFEVLSSSSVLPVFEVYFRPPARLVRWYRRAMRILEKTPGLRKFGVSTFVLARRPTGSTGRHATSHDTEHA